MTGYKQVSLKEMIEQLGESRVKSILSSFSCPKNADVEKFIKHTAITFAKQGLSVTHLVFGSYKDAPVLIGYYTLTTKIFFISDKKISGTYKKKLSKFGVRDTIEKGTTLQAPLIAQLGKNFTNGYNELITGDELLKMAIDKVVVAQQALGGKVVYLECEDKPNLIQFYSDNGFVNFGKRNLDRDERDVVDGAYLVQMLKYLP